MSSVITNDVTFEVRGRDALIEMMGLTLEERGFLFSLLAVKYGCGWEGGFPVEQDQAVARLMGIDLRLFRRMKRQLIDSDFLEECDDVTHIRLAYAVEECRASRSY